MLELFFLLKILINNCFFHLHLRLDKPHNTAMLQNILKVVKVIITIVHQIYFLILKGGDIDFVNSVCPCAGLSMLNTSVKVNAVLSLVITIQYSLLINTYIIMASCNHVIMFGMCRARLVIM